MTSGSVSQAHPNLTLLWSFVKGTFEFKVLISNCSSLIDMSEITLIRQSTNTKIKEETRYVKDPHN